MDIKITKPIIKKVKIKIGAWTINSNGNGRKKQKKNKSKKLSIKDEKKPNQMATASLNHLPASAKSLFFKAMDPLLI